MRKFTVALACVTDMTARVDIDAATAEEAVAAALERHETDAADIEWEFPDNPPEPMYGPVEAFQVSEGDAEPTDLPQTTGTDYANARAYGELLLEAVNAWPAFDDPD